jgi:hypothetical protein
MQQRMQAGVEHLFKLRREIYEQSTKGYFCVAHCQLVKVAQIYVLDFEVVICNKT